MTDPEYVDGVEALTLRMMLQDGLLLPNASPTSYPYSHLSVGGPRIHDMVRFGPGPEDFAQITDIVQMADGIDFIQLTTKLGNRVYGDRWNVREVLLLDGPEAHAALTAAPRVPGPFRESLPRLRPDDYLLGSVRLRRWARRLSARWTQPLSPTPAPITSAPRLAADRIPQPSRPADLHPTARRSEPTAPDHDVVTVQNAQIRFPLYPTTQPDHPRTVELPTERR